MRLTSLLCIVVTAVLVMLTAPALAQHRVDVGLDSHAVAHRDQVASAVAFTGLTTAAGVGYEYRKPRFEFGTELGFQAGNLAAPGSDSLQTSRLGLALDVHGLFQLDDLGHWALFGGLALENGIVTHEHFAGGFVQYTGTFVGAAHVRAARAFGEHELTVDLSVPLVGYMARPPYAMESNELWTEGSSIGGLLGMGEFASLHNLQRGRLAASWRWAAWRSVAVGFEGAWQLQRITTPRSYLESDLSVALVVSFLFGGHR